MLPLFAGPQARGSFVPEQHRRACWLGLCLPADIPVGQARNREPSYGGGPHAAQPGTVYEER